MPSRLWPRLAFEAFFLIAVALVGWLLGLSVTEVIVAIAIACVLAVALELATWYLRRRRRADAGAPEPVEDVTDVEPSSAAVVARLERLAPLGAVRPEPEPEQESAGEAESEQEPQPVPTSEPQPAEPQPDVEDEERGAGPEPELEPAAVAPVLAAVPELEPEPEPEPEREQEPVVAPVANLPLPSQPREWNLWELERLTRNRAGEDQARDVEWSYLVVYLRDFARPDGTLPAEFDDLVRESFGEILATGFR